MTGEQKNAAERCSVTRSAAQPPRDPEDGRAYQVHLTAPGRKLTEPPARDIARAEAEVLMPLTEPEQRTFKRLLRKLLSTASPE